MNSNDQPLSDCHQASVVLCEGNAWDVSADSIKDGSTYGYGCTVCHEWCGMYEPNQPSTPDAHTQPVVGDDELEKILQRHYAYLSWESSPQAVIESPPSADSLDHEQLKAALQAHTDVAVDAALEDARKHTYTASQVREAIRRQLGTKTGPDMVAIIIEDVSAHLDRLTKGGK